MTIAAKIRIFSILLLIISAAFGYSFWSSSQNLQSQRNINNIVQAIIKNTFEFSFITNEHITKQNPRTQSQWESSHLSLENLFLSANKLLHFNDDIISLKKIIQNERQAEAFLISAISQKSLSHKTIQITSQIDIRLQGMLSEAARMSRRSLNRLTEAEQQLEFKAILLLSVYFSLFIMTLLLIRKNIIKPIINLQTNAKQLAMGDYDSRIPVIGKDEISALAQSYNTLASEIQKKINSLTEQSERLTESQKELLLFNDNLQTMVEEQTSDLRNSESKQRAILESMTDGVITLDNEFIIKSINPAAMDIFGYTSENIINKKLSLIISNAKSNVKKNGVFQEKEGHHKNGLLFPIETSINGMIINDTMMYTCIVRDITERKRVEKMKGEFVSNVSHELRTPLTSIRGALGLVTSGALDELPDKANELLTTAYNNTDRLMHLINDLLDMQKIEAGKLDFNIIQVDLEKAMEKSIIDNNSYAKQHHINIEVGTLVENILIKADPLRLDQIMSNLLSNAVKFSPEESSVFINTSVEGSFARISVVDTGEGIPEEYFATIFNKFTQNDASATRQKGGTGLGLTITKQMVEAMGGSINFTSAVDKGTTFNIHLPLDH